MRAKRILETDIAAIKVSSLPTRPTAASELGGRGFTSVQMREAFDKLPLYIIDTLNTLFDDIERSGEDSLCAAIPTGIREGHTLADLLCDITNGNLVSYIKVGDKTLSEVLSELSAKSAGAETVSVQATESEVPDDD